MVGQLLKTREGPFDITLEIAVGVPGVAKFGATGVQKVASLVGPARSIPIAGTSFIIPGRVLGEYSTIKTGPLDPLMAGNFSGGRYKEIILKEDVILYRAGISDVPKGQYYSMDKPMGVVQSRIDKAILPEWPTGDKSIINAAFEIKVAKGTKVYLGEVGAQESIYVGGTHQIVIPQAWKNPGVEVISKEILE